MNTIELFKNDLWNGISQHAKKLFSPMLVVTILYFIVIMGLMVTIFSSFFDLQMLKEMSDMSKAFDLEAMAERNAVFEEMFREVAPGSLVLGMVALYGALIIMGSWFMNLMLILSQDVLLTGRTSVGDAFKAAFNKDVWKLVGFTVLMIILWMLLILIAGALSRINIALTFLGGVAAALVMLRFISAPGAIVHGRMGVGQSMSFSWKNITFMRALKAFVVGIVIMIILFLIMLVAGAVSSMLGATFGMIISWIIQIGITVILYAVIYSGLSAAFFRYAEVDVETDEVGHLVEEE